MTDSWNAAVLNDAIRSGGAGGGSQVEANPEGVATDELEKLGIGDIIYSVPKASDFSTTEHLTGRKWVDGSDIYEKSFVSTSALSASNTISHGITDLDLVIHCDTIIKTSSKDHQIPITTDDNNATIDITPSSVVIELSSNYVTYRATGGYIITLEYTKVTTP